MQHKYPLTVYPYTVQFKTGDYWRDASLQLLFSFAISDAKRYPKWRVIRNSDKQVIAFSKNAYEQEGK